MPAKLNEIISISVPSRAALAGNPSDLATAQGIGAVFSIPIWQYVATVSFHPADQYYIRGPETTAGNFADALALSTQQGIGNGENLFLAANAVFREMLDLAQIQPTEQAFAVYWSTTIPRQRGLSGSSALIIAYLKCLLKLHGLDGHPDFQPNFLANWALKVETDYMGTAAGLQDRVVQSLAHQADAILMDFSQEAFARQGGQIGEYKIFRNKTAPPFALLIADAPSHSGQAHQKIKGLLQCYDPATILQIKDIADLAFSAAQYYNQADWLRLGQIMKANSDARVRLYGEEALGDANLAILKICELAGCFPNFTGSGGAAIVLLPGEREKSLHNLKTVIKNHDFKCNLVELS